MRFGVVAIGRNEGERLKRCLQSVSTAAVVVYVDSGSTDGSAKWARDQGSEVIDLYMSVPFTAARARNAYDEPHASSVWHFESGTMPVMKRSHLALLAAAACSPLWAQDAPRKWVSARKPSA